MYWHNHDKIAQSLEDNYPDYEIETTKTKEIEEMIKSLNDFDEHYANPSKETLNSIIENWLDLRAENN